MIGASSASEIARLLGPRRGLTLRDSRLGGVVLDVETEWSRTRVSLYGGQVLSFVPHGGSDVLWLSPLARLGTGKAVRGGVPVCWPWFGPHPADRSLPAHGLVRTREWRIDEVTARDDGATFLRLVPDVDAPAGLTVGVALELVMGKRLELALITHNGGEQPVMLTEALHTYVAVGDIARIQVDGLNGCDYVDQLDGNALKPQLGVVTIASEVDRIYRTLGGPVTVIDPVLGRRVVISTSGSASTVVWNPWVEKAARLGDVEADGYRRFVCVETANAGPDAVSIAGGTTHRLTASIDVAPL